MSYNEKFMKLAIKEANNAAKKGECPIGAVIVKNGEVVSKGHNLREAKESVLSHAELIAIGKANKKLNSWRLIDCDLYVTLEPCPMCSGAIIQSRILNVYFGAYDAKAGAAGSKVNLFENNLFNHNVNIYGGIMQEDCSKLLSDFFKLLREKKENVKL